MNLQGCTEDLMTLYFMMKQAKDNEVKGLREIKDKIGKFEGTNIKRYLKHYYEIMDSYGVNTKDKISCFHRIFEYELKPQLKLIEEQNSDNWEDFQEGILFEYFHDDFTLSDLEVFMLAKKRKDRHELLTIEVENKLKQTINNNESTKVESRFKEISATTVMKQIEEEKGCGTSKTY